MTQTWEMPAHLLRLRDGRVLLTYGNRRAGEFGVCARLSADEGRSWDSPQQLVISSEDDCGYPSSVQNADGTIVTVYYSKATSDHPRYHMGVVLWPAGNIPAS